MKHAMPEMRAAAAALAAIQGPEKGDGHTDATAPRLPEISSGAYETGE